MMLISASFTDGTLQEKGRLVRKIKLQNITELIGGKKNYKWLLLTMQLGYPPQSSFDGLLTSAGYNGGYLMARK